MRFVDVKNPVFKIILDHNVHAIEHEMRLFSIEGWYPIGDLKKHGNDWVQVIVREKEELTIMKGNVA